MNWETVSAGLNAIERGGPSVEVNGVEYDSRRVGRGDVFVAMRGEATDGNRFVEASVAKWGEGGSEGGGEGEVVACSRAGASVGAAGGCGDLYESDAGSSGLSRDDGK